MNNLAIYIMYVFFFKTGFTGAGEMAQWLRALPALPRVLSSIPSNHMVTHNHLYWCLVPSFDLQAYTQTEYCRHT